MFWHLNTEPVTSKNSVISSALSIAILLNSPSFPHMTLQVFPPALSKSERLRCVPAISFGLLQLHLFSINILNHHKVTRIQRIDVR